MRSKMLLFWKPRREALLFPRGVDSCCPDGRRGGGGGGSERRRGGGRRQGHGNLQEDSRGPAAAERTPNLSLPAQPNFSFLFLQKILPSFYFIYFFLPPHSASFLLPQPSVGRTWAGKAAPWLGRTETPAEERRGRNKSTTSRRFLILKKSSAREYTELHLTSPEIPLWCYNNTPGGVQCTCGASDWLYGHLCALNSQYYSPWIIFSETETLKHYFEVTVWAMNPLLLAISSVCPLVLLSYFIIYPL